MSSGGFRSAFWGTGFDSRQVHFKKNFLTTVSACLLWVRCNDKQLGACEANQGRLNIWAGTLRRPNPLKAVGFLVSQGRLPGGSHEPDAE